MKKVSKVTQCLYIIRYTIYLIIAIGILFSNSLQPKLDFYFILFVLLIINDHYRWYGKYYDTKYSYYIYNISLIISIIVGTIICFYYYNSTNIYLLLLLGEVIYYTHGIKQKVYSFILIAFFILYNIGFDYDKSFLLNISKNILASFFMLLWMLLNLAFFLYFKYQHTEKQDVIKLKNDLEASYLKLREYSDKVEELTIEKERNRVAQEIHDSLGHSLTAIIMHLEYIDKIVEDEPKTAKELLEKTQALARKSMEDVRKAVYQLTDKDAIHKGLIASIEDMISNVKANEEITVSCCLEEDIEQLSPNIKNTIFKTIQEGITNSIKHGRATEFNIEALLTDRSLKLIVEDNGKGCNSIIKGKGIKGIEERIKLIGGEVSFNSNEGEGFSITMSLPLGEMLDEENKANAGG